MALIDPKFNGSWRNNIINEFWMPQIKKANSFNAESPCHTGGAVVDK
jgi:hypothetical protein